MNVVITGATKGIGKSIAVQLARKGFNLGICSRNEIDLAEVKNLLLEINPAIQVFTSQTDVSKKKEIQEFGRFCIEKLGKIDALINNAGVFIPGNIHAEAEGALEQMIETNLYSAYNLTRILVPGMMERKSGYIINISSIAGFMAYPNGGSYSISKFAMSGFSKVLREEMKAYGIKVTTILPGATWSASWEGADFPDDRLMQSDDIAKAVTSIFDLSPSAVIEEMIIRPQEGDL